MTSILAGTGAMRKSMGKAVRACVIGAALCAIAPLATAPAMAQGLFSPVITVNERAITLYELQQRERLLTFFNTPGDVAEVARTGLIDDRLRQQALDRAGLRLTDQGLQFALTEFAGRANLSAEELIAAVTQAGIDADTLREFVATSATWRDFVRSRFAAGVTVSEAEIDAEIARSATTSADGAVEVLLSEIIIPAPPGREAEAQTTAFAISQITSIAAFAAEARRVSVVPSRDNDGRLDWAPLSNYPPALRNVLANLAPGQVTPPINITNGVALLQLRGLREGRFRPADVSEIDYAVFHIPGGRNEAAMATAQDIAAHADSCDDLYGIARDLPPQRLDRVQSAPGAIPQDVAMQLAQLDAGEVSVALTSDNGDTLLFLMLCGRSYAAGVDLDRAAVANALRGRKLSQQADILLAELRAAAVIVGE
jgi:peptidyl-prolyl cis-trans isomerase SurA